MGLPGQGPDLGQAQGRVAGQAQGMALAQDLDHAVQVEPRVLVDAHPVPDPRGTRGLVLPGQGLVHRAGRLDRALHGEAPADPGDLVVDLRAVHQGDGLRLLVVGDGFQRDARDQAADLLALPVLLALVDEAAGRAAARLLQFVPGEGGGQEPLPGQGQRDPGGVAGDPAPAPLLGHIGRGPRAAGGVEDQIAGVGGHQDAALNDLRSSSERHSSFRARSRCCPYHPKGSLAA